MDKTATKSAPRKRGYQRDLNCCTGHLQQQWKLLDSYGPEAQTFFRFSILAAPFSLLAPFIIMEIPIAYLSEEQLEIIADHWALRIREMLLQRFSGPEEVHWHKEPPPPKAGARTEYIQYFDIFQKKRRASYVRVVWNATEPKCLRITAGSEGLPKTESFLGMIFGYLALLGAVAAFLSWIWFIWEDWRRILNRVFSFTPGYDAERATKLEVWWLLLGWACGPLFVGFGIKLIGEGFDGYAHQRRKAKLEAFARKNLDGILADLRANVLVECTRDATTTMNFGQNHPGSTCPAHQNVVYAASGNLCPAPGYTWATNDVASNEVKLVEGPE